MDEPESEAKARVFDALYRFQKNWPRMTDHTITEHERHLSTSWAFFFFHYVVLIETVRQHDAAEADRLVEWLDSMTEDGGMGEQMWEWLRALDAGRPIELPDLNTAQEQ